MWSLLLLPQLPCSCRMGTYSSASRARYASSASWLISPGGQQCAVWRAQRQSREQDACRDLHAQRLKGRLCCLQCTAAVSCHLNAAGRKLQAAEQGVGWHRASCLSAHAHDAHVDGLTHHTCRDILLHAFLADAFGIDAHKEDSLVEQRLPLHNSSL